MICSRCIYDDKIPYISFDGEGICNYCKEHERLDLEYPTGKEGWNILTKLAEKIKYDGKNKKYDVVVGVSGGCDSSYLLYLSKKLGLRTLAAHFDNTWNTEIGIKNLNIMIEKLGVGLYTHVVDSGEACDIFRSTLKASIINADVWSDIGLATTHYLAAEKYGVKYIFEGHSFRTEGISPRGLFYMDGKFVESIQKQFGSYRISTFPNLWLNKWLRWLIVNRIKKIRPLYYIDYNKEDIKKFLNKEFGWQWYGGHHMENKTACFGNNYFKPLKFDFDLRNIEYSALIRSGQMLRSEALQKIKNPYLFDKSILEEIKKRLNFTDDEFEEIVKLPFKTYHDYKTYKKTFEKMRWFFWVMYKFNLVTKSFYMKFTKKEE